MRVHELKTWVAQFKAVVDGRKTFEVRRNDRDYKEGDIVLLREYVQSEDAARAEEATYDLNRGDVKTGYTGRTAGPFRIGYVEDAPCMPATWVGFELIRLVPEAS